MKIAIATSGNDLSSALDARFGRAPHFLVVDLDNDNVTAHTNQQNLDASQGAGIQAAQNVVALKVGALIACNVGPKAFRVFQHAGIPVYLCKGNCSAAEAVKAFKAGELQKADGANVLGHWA